MRRLTLVAQLVKNPPAVQETQLDSWVGKVPWSRDRLPTPVCMGFPCGSDSKESACNAGEPGSVPGLGGFLGERYGNPLQYSCLKNPKDRGAWRALWGHKESDTTQ